MALAFPANPAVGDLLDGPFGEVYRFDGIKWTLGGRVDEGGAVVIPNVSVTMADTPPTAPVVGDFFWDTTEGQLYISFDDGDSQQWVVVVNQVGPTGPPGPSGRGLTPKGSLPSAANLPTGGNEVGDLWLAEDTNTAWVWDGTTWISLGQLLRGPAGPPGPSTISVGATTTRAPNLPATVTNSGSALDVVLNFGIPRGANAYTYTAFGFPSPAIGASATIEVQDAGWMAVDLPLFIAGMIFTVETIVGNTVTAQRIF